LSKYYFFFFSVELFLLKYFSLIYITIGGRMEINMMAIMTSVKFFFTAGTLPKKKPALKKRATQVMPPITLYETNFS
jgi:hypothetical protein